LPYPLSFFLPQGSDAANEQAYATLDNVKKAMGFGAAAVGRRRPTV
jgi:hypothetical protein